MNKEELKQLKVTALHCRQNVLRMIKANGSGHLGPAFSCLDIVTALYFHVMDVDPKNPDKEDRDRFLLSAGHKGMAQYAALAEKGYFDREILDTFGQFKCRIPGHPDMHKLPGIEVNTGSLGHGLNLACGMALALRQDRKKSRVFALMGDGELAEGSNWEAAAAAAHHKVDNLTAFVDFNGLQISGNVTEVMNFTPIDEKFRAFGWAVREIDGNDMKQIVETLDALPFEPGKPSMIVAHTVKSKGLKQGEGKAAFHYWNASPEDCDALDRDLISMLDEKEE